MLLIGVAVCWRSWLQYRRHGTWGIVAFRSRRRGQNLRDAMLVTFFLLFLGQAVLVALQPDWLSARLLVRDPA